MPLPAGTEVGRYVISEQIGSGGMGEVYRARDPRLNRDVAVKVLVPELSANREAVARFEREAITASALNHPHILHVYDVGQEIIGEERISFIAMELIDGATLRDAVAQESDVRRTVGYLIQVGEALSKAHAAGIVHRDLKPENVMVTVDGYAKVLDFGLAKLAAAAGPMTEQTAIMPVRTSVGVAVGTAGYMAPEQAEGRETDRRSDIFAFGCVLFEMISGTSPFRGASTIDTLHNLLHSEPRYEALPESLQPIARRCLAKRPADRYQTIDEVVADLRRVNLESSQRTKQTGRSSKQIDSIAVLPFANTSKDSESEYLSEGITETLINSLSHLPKLRVVPRSTVFRYRDRDDVATIAKELNVRAILTGRVSHRDDRIVVGAELIDVAHDAQLWGDQYSRPVSDLLEVQKTIAEDIAQHLRPKLSGQTRRRVVKIHTEDPGAYQLYLKGRYNLNKRSAEALRKAVDFFQQAIDRDPGYARGYAGLADAWVLLGWYAIERPRQAFPRALAAARQAVAIDPSFAEARTSVAYAVFLAEWDVETSEREFERALHLNDNYAIAHHWHADLLQATGRAAEAIAEAKRACELDPLALILNAELGRACYYARLFDKAIEQQKKTLDLEPAFGPSLLFLGQAYDQSGQSAEAMEAFKTGVEVSHDNPIYLGYYGYSLGRGGRKSEARDILARLTAASAERWIPAFAIALVAFGVGDWEETWRWMNVALEERSHWLLYARVDPAFEKLWTDRRFAEIEDRIPKSH